MLQIKNLHAQFEETVILKGVSLNIKAGETHVILGPNGSGKSTLGHVILGDKRFKKTNGDIIFETQNFDPLSTAERAQAGFFLSFQSPPEISGVSVRDFLFASKKAIDPNFSSSFRFKKNLEKSFKELRLPAHFSERETNVGFSGGERKKTEMASLEMLDPKLAFFDEIDSGVDIDTVKNIANSIKDFMQNQKKAVIIISHSEKLLKEITPTHVHILCNGKIVRSGGQEIIKKVHQDGFDTFLEAPKNPKFSGFRVLKKS